MGVIAPDYSGFGNRENPAIFSYSFDCYTGWPNASGNLGFVQRQSLQAWRIFVDSVSNRRTATERDRTSTAGIFVIRMNMKVGFSGVA